MRVGAVFPQAEIGPDVGAVRAYAEGVDQLGYDHLLAYDHVLGADREVHDWPYMPYDVHTNFHEPFVLFGFLAGFTSLELVTGIIILPQRQTALVAKQAAEVDLLTQGRLRLGVGVGWNPLEFQGLGKDFHDRGRRLDEQVEFLRRLWTEPSFSFEGEHEQMTGGGMAPLPVQRPIPIWFGAASPPAYRRVGRLGDGWFPLVPPGPHLDEALEAVLAGAAEAGRDPATIGMEGRVNVGPGGAEQLLDHLGRWREVGATHVTVNTMHGDLPDVDAHLEVLREVADGLDLPPRP